MKKTFLALLAVVIGSFGVSLLGEAQSDQKPLAFEVASIKAGVPADVPGGIRPVSAGGEFYAVLTLHDFVQVAFGSPLALLASQVVGGPAWVMTERFEIVAKANGLVTSPTGGRAELGAMIRTLLTDRFRLRLRKESREMPIFNLVLDRTDGRLGPRLHPADGTCVGVASVAGADPSRWCGFKRVTPGSISARGMTLDQFASGISTRADIQRVVKDRTGLAGKFDLDIEYTPDVGAPGDPQSVKPDAVGLSTAMREQLGLRLESGKAMIDVFVIDRVEHPTRD